MEEILNPYIAGAPVLEARMFFGREDVFDWIEKSLSGQFADHILVVHGQRRVGKTSVLKQLGNRLPKKYVPVFFDLQGRTHTTLDRFLWWLARETVRVLKQERGIEIPIPDKEDFTKDPEYFESIFLHNLQPILGDASLLYTFDEFDNLEETEVKEELARPLTDYLRRLMGKGEINFIFSIGSSGRKLENMQAAYTEFFKTALYKKISFLSSEQTYNLVTAPVSGVIEYERSAVERIFAVASGHPYFTQLTCHELFARCQRTDQRVISVADVEAILDDVVERGTVNLKFVWDEASDIERWSLAALAQMEKADTRALADYLRKQHVRFSDTDLTSGLLHLREKDVLTSDNQFVIHLLKLWLLRNRPIEQVREELTEVNPIANRYIEIGLEFKDAGLFDKAVDSFREALEISPDSSQARVNIALTYLDQKAYAKAITEFELVLKMDDEDVSARAGLCDAHLALGDSAIQKNRPKEAIQSYQRVLSINGEHTEARQRMAELNSLRAEKALSEGKDEEALGAFSDALKFTPEDPVLISRVEAVRKEKITKVLSAQIARSEKESAAGNWDKAISALNEALETAPDDGTILRKISEIKERQLKEKLAGIRIKVDQAEKAARWDVAIEGLNEYLQLKPGDEESKKRIAYLIEAKHAALLAAVLARTEQAVAANNWDGAEQVLRDALRMEPENSELQEKAASVKEARRAAELEGLLTRAGAAISAARWDEAIDLLNDGLVSYPENEILKSRVTEARQSKREARHNAALRLAETAAATGKWEAAIQSLNEVLAAEPDNTLFLDKLNEIKNRERETKFSSLHSQALALTSEEKFDDALAIWNEYLALEPADRQTAFTEMEKVKKAKTLSELYSGASAAFTEKNYEKAVDLFKRVIIEDADYRDATELLAVSVRLRRAGGKSSRSFNKKNWIIAGVIAIVAVGLVGAIYWIAKNGLPALPAGLGNKIGTPADSSIPANGMIQTPDPTPDPRVVYSANQHSYYFYENPKNWHDAQDFCIDQGGYLVTIQDPDENEFVYKLSNGSTWLGATDEVSEGVWVWSSGEPLIYTNWGKNQPDNDDHGNAGLEHFMHYLDEFPFQWNDAPDTLEPFVCEWDPVRSVNSGKTITVTSSADSGPGTLREAMLDAVSGDIIRFDPAVFPKNDPTVIYLKSGLPQIRQGYQTIDASNAGVILDGSMFATDSNWVAGIDITSSYNVIKGLQIQNFSGPGIFLNPDANYNIIGGARNGSEHPGEGNILLGNSDGIAIMNSSDNTIRGNLIGVDVLGSVNQGNRAPGIFLEEDSSRNSIGPDNVIAYNETGVEIRSETAIENIISANLIFDNISPGIMYNMDLNGQDFDLTAPVITYFDLEIGVAAGTACKKCMVEVFSTDTQDGKVFEGGVMADEYGNFIFRKGVALTGPFLTATEISKDRNTSMYSIPTGERTVIQAAMQYLNENAPVFETEFDSTDGIDGNGFSVENGKLIVRSEIGDHSNATPYSFEADSFVVEFVVQSLDSDPEGHCIYEIGNEDSPRRAVSLVFFADHQEVELNRYVYLIDGHLALARESYDGTIANKVLLIMVGDQFAVFVNDSLAFTTVDPGGKAVYWVGGLSASQDITCEFDHYKIWDLHGVDLNQ